MRGGERLLLTFCDRRGPQVALPHANGAGAWCAAGRAADSERRRGGERL